MHGMAWKGHLLGLDRDGAVRLGERPLSMTDGIWLMKPNLPAQRRHADVLVSPEELSLVLIP